jgi:transcriptional regulator with XRE-family HTH domain
MGGYGERLALALRRNGMKQLDFAEKLGITQTAISKIIHGTQYLDFDLAVRACEVLDISLDWLAHGDPPETASRPVYYREPNRQRIEYLLSILTEAEYPLVIVAMEEIIEIRLGDKKNPGLSQKKKDFGLTEGKDRGGRTSS